MTVAGVPSIGVFPRRQREIRTRLFDVLERALEVSLPSRQPGEHHGLDGAIVIGEPDETVRALVAAGVPCLVAPEEPPGPATDHEDIQFSSSQLLDHRLRGHTLAEHTWSWPRPLDLVNGGTPLACGSSGVVWAVRHEGSVALHEVALPPRELGDGDRLKDHLCHSRFLALLPVVHFVRDVVGTGGWTPPDRRACLVIDDPNLHWPSYGYVNFERLAAHAAAHRYHVSIGTVPIDTAFAHRRAVEVFRSCDALSLSMHGVDHSKRELAQTMPTEAAVAKMGRALQWVKSFERRYEVTVDRVMIPPHGVISFSTMEAVRLAGFEAIFFEGMPTGSGDRLAGWHPADMHLAGGLPSFHRHPLPGSTDEAVLRGFLDQPVVLAGHHDDAGSLDRLSATVAAVNGAGDFRWLSLSRIARSNYFLRHSGSLLEVRPFTRHLDLEVPEGVTRLAIRMPGTHANQHSVLAMTRAGSAVFPVVPVGAEIELPEEGERRLRLRITTPDDLPAGAVPVDQCRAWPVVRRCLSIGRDRMVSLVRRRGVHAALAGQWFSEPI